MPASLVPPWRVPDVWRRNEVRPWWAWSCQAHPPIFFASFTWTCKKGTLTATVDPGKQVAESDETNNSLAKVTSCLGLGS